MQAAAAAAEVLGAEAVQWEEVRSTTRGWGLPPLAVAVVVAVLVVVVWPHQGLVVLPLAGAARRCLQA